MSLLGMIDLPYLIDSRNGSVNDMTVVGVLVGEVHKPESLEGINLKDVDDRCVLIDLVGVQSAFSNYYVKGQILAVVKRHFVDKAKQKNSGRIAIALSGGALRMNDSHEGKFIHMTRWTRNSNLGWQIGSVGVEAVTKARYPEFFDVIASAYARCWDFEFPVIPDKSYQVASDGYHFRLLSEGDSAHLANTATPVNALASTAVAVVDKETLAPSVGTNLGVATDSGVATLVSNRTITDRELKDTRKFSVQNRNNTLSASKHEKHVESLVRQANGKVHRVLETLSTLSGISDGQVEFQERKLFAASRLNDSWANRQGDFTGRALFKQAVVMVLSDHDGLDADKENQLNMLFDIKGQVLLQDWASLDMKDFDSELVKDIAVSGAQIYVALLDITLGLSGRLLTAYAECVKHNISLEKLLDHNPYDLCFLEPTFPVYDLDKLAMYFDIDVKQPAIQVSRDVAYMHNFMLDASNRVVGNNTVVAYKALTNAVYSGYILAKRNYDMLQLTGFTVKHDRLLSIGYYLNADLKMENFQLPKDGWRQRGQIHVLPNDRSSKFIIDNYINSGLGVSYEIANTTYVSDYVMASKEIFIHKRLRQLAKSDNNSPYPRDEISNLVEKFEQEVDKKLGLSVGSFKLERQQVEALNLVHNNVICLTGPAGSGKTTTAEALVYALENVIGVPKDAILFCAPTGKAARRLKEVVKRKTRTIHSLFGVGGNSMSLHQGKNIKELQDVRALIVDESSMPNVNLVYEMLLRIPDGTRIFFLGDIEQLPPIGFGKPFANMLSYLPTVVLNVTKRASDKSGITQNAKKVIYESEGLPTDLTNHSDFVIVNEPLVDNLVPHIENIIKYHTGKQTAIGFTPVSSVGNDLTPDDIQVISPINGKTWGVISLNKMLQGVYNPHNPISPSVTLTVSKDLKTIFRLGDRVIHTKVNMPDRVRLVRMGRHSFVREETTGINNGDVGKVVGFHKPSDLDFSLSEDAELEKALHSEFRGSDNIGFVEVEYKDVSEHTGEPIRFSVLYKYSITLDMGLHNEVIGKDISSLELAYALTVDKMQGSEAKLVLVVMLPVYGDFISRNRIYTAMTRAREGEYLLGDIRGTKSCINLGRKIQQTERRLTLLDTF